MQIVPIRQVTSARGRLLDLLDREEHWSFLRAPAGYDKFRTVQAWLNAHPRRRADARWIDVPSANRVDPAAVKALLAKERRVKTLVLDATRVQHPLDLATLQAVGARAHRVIVIARSTQVLPEHLGALLDAQILDADTLAYRLDEISELAPALDAEEAARICEAAAGWPVLVRLAVAQQPQISLKLDSIVAAFATEQLAQLSSLALRVFTTTCHVDGPTVTLTAGLSGFSREEARQGWREIVALGFAAVEGPGEHLRWRVIPLVRKAFLAQLRNEHPEARRELDRKAARWFAQHEQPVEAARHAIEAEDWTTAAEVIEEAAFSLFSEHPDVARDLVSRIPSGALEEKPLAKMFSDLLISTGEGGFSTTMALRRLPGHWPPNNSADELLQRLDIDGVNAVTRWREAISRRVKGDFTGALKIQSAQDIRFRDPARTSSRADRGLLPMVHLQYGNTLMLAGRFEDAERAFADAKNDAHPGFASMARRAALGTQALLAGVEGDFVRAQENLDQMRKSARIKGFWSRAAKFVEFVSESLIATARLQLDEADSILDGVARLADHDELWVFYLLARARHAVADGTAVAVLAEVSAMRRIRQHLAGPDSAAAFLLPWAEAELLLAAGQAVHAGAVLDAAPLHPLLAGIRILQRVQVGEPSEGIALAGAALWSDEAGPAARALGFLARAVAELQLDLREDAARSFRFAHKLLTSFGDRRTLGLFQRNTIAELIELTDLRFEFELDDIPEMLPAPPRYVAMTEREFVVLKQLTTGATVAGIARALFVSENTVRSQVRSLYRKLGVNSRDEAVAEAERRGLTSELPR